MFQQIAFAPPAIWLPERLLIGCIPSSSAFVFIIRTVTQLTNVITAAKVVNPRRTLEEE